MGGMGWAGWSGVRGGEWDNCNSIINKYIKKIFFLNLLLPRSLILAELICFFVLGFLSYSMITWTKDIFKLCLLSSDCL